jgi:hypothetical protein
MSKVDWSLAPIDAQYGGIYAGRFSCWYLRDGDQWFYTSNISGGWEKVVDNKPSSDLIRRPQPQPKPWSGPEDGLPPVGTECEFRYYVEDFKIWHKGACIALGRSPEGEDICVTQSGGVIAIYRSGEHLRAIRTPDQIAADQRETAIREVMDIAQVDCRVTAARLVDAGFKREVV